LLVRSDWPFVNRTVVRSWAIGWGLRRANHGFRLDEGYDGWPFRWSGRKSTQPSDGTLDRRDRAVNRLSQANNPFRHRQHVLHKPLRGRVNPLHERCGHGLDLVYEWRDRPDLVHQCRGQLLDRFDNRRGDRLDVVDEWRCHRVDIVDE
jgi:hypothetical protein